MRLLDIFGRRKRRHTIWGHVAIQIPAFFLILLPVVKFVGCMHPKAAPEHAVGNIPSQSP